MSNDYTLPEFPPLPEPTAWAGEYPDGTHRWKFGTDNMHEYARHYGHACAEHVRAEITPRVVEILKERDAALARVERLESLLSGFVSDIAEELGCAADNESILLAAGQLRAELAAKAGEVEALRGFAQKVMEAWPECGLDGLDLEDHAKEFGLIQPTRVEGPCGEDCACLDACADWPTDCYHRTPLLTGSGPWVNPLAAEVEKLRADKERIEEVQNEYLRIEPFEMPTPGGDDADVGWRIYTHHRQAPRLREVACYYADDLRAAIDEAIAARKGEGK